MAVEASGAVVCVPVLAVVVVGELALVVVADDAAEHTVIVRVGMALSACVPLTVVIPAIDGEVHGIVIER